MLANVHPKLPMRNKAVTQAFYTHLLGFEKVGAADYEGYLMLRKDAVEIHFFEFKALNIEENYGQVYIRVVNIAEQYKKFLQQKAPIHPNGALSKKPWGQMEFAILDPDNNLLTFGEAI